MDQVERKQWQSMVSSTNPELLKKAQKELNEDLDRRAKDIQKLKKMILADAKFTSPTDDAFLLRFLRVYKFDHEKAFKLLQQYFSIQIKYPEVFVDYRPSANLSSLNQNVDAIMPMRDQEGRRIYIHSIGRWDQTITTAEDILRMFHMCVDHTLREEETQVNGIVMIHNMKNLKWNHVTPFLSPRNSKRGAAILQDCLPALFKAFHVVFEPSIFHLAFYIVKPFFNEATTSRVHIHGNNLASLHQHIHPQYLPEEFGGLQPPIDNSSMVQSLLANDDEIANSVSNFGYLKAS